MNKIIGHIKEFDNTLLNETWESLTNEDRIISKREIILFEWLVFKMARDFIDAKLLSKRYFQKVNELLNNNRNELDIRYTICKYLMLKIKELE